ncbi:nitroreductase family protein [Nitrospinae bacterium AH_259_B05_G02_I21]|nr:nitroreductase family protein [Nitrospinae bacterium AH_259_B05_G02_I21]
MGERMTNLPTVQSSGEPALSVAEAIAKRRSHRHFKPDPLPEGLLDEVLGLATLAPSGYNLQPWRFIVVSEPEAKERLWEVSYKQPKILEAPATVICCGETTGWATTLEEMLAEGLRLGAYTEGYSDHVRKAAGPVVEGWGPDLWVNRHIMIAATCLMLAAESLGVESCPMEGFEEERVKEAFDIPEDVRVVCIVSLGYATEPPKAFPGRLPLETLVFWQGYGQPKA